MSSEPSLKTSLIFTFVGHQVMAVKNSLLLMLNTHVDVFAKKVIFGFTEGSLKVFKQKHSSPTEWGKQVLFEGKKKLFMENLLPNTVEVLHGKISHEHDIVKIKSEVLQIIKENLSDEINTIIIDVTPGRKTMGIAGFLAAVELYKELKNKNVYLHYYWFKTSIQAKDKEREAWEIYEDEYETKLWPIKELVSSL